MYCRKPKGKASACVPYTVYNYEAVLARICTVENPKEKLLPVFLIQFLIMKQFLLGYVENPKEKLLPVFLIQFLIMKQFLLGYVENPKEKLLPVILIQFLIMKQFLLGYVL